MQKINFISFQKAVLEQEEKFGGKCALLPFYKNSKVYDEKTKDGKLPLWGMTTKKAGTMRFRWNEKNDNRLLLEEYFGKDRITPVELIHSKIIYEAESSVSTINLKGDGVVALNPNLLPAVTVADCVPVFVFDVEKNVFAALHSGWKGTGIAADCVKLFEEKYGSQKKDICIAIGPHIESCYFVDDERAAYFIENFGSECVEKTEKGQNKLSLLKANLLALEKIDFPFENIVAATECTCASRIDGGEGEDDYLFGSCRRETEGISGLTPEEFSRKFTVQAAFIGLL